MSALPSDFNGHVTFDVRQTLQVCMIYHWSYVDPKTVYQGLTHITGLYGQRPYPVKLEGRAEPYNPLYYGVIGARPYA